MLLIWIAGGMMAALLIVKTSALSLWLGETTVLVIVVGLLTGLSGAGWPGRFPKPAWANNARAAGNKP